MNARVAVKTEDGRIHHIEVMLGELNKEQWLRFIKDLGGIRTSNYFYPYHMIQGIEFH